MTPNDVQTLQIGSSPAMMAALEKGGIDAAVLTEPTFFFADDQGYRTLADLADMDIYYLHSMIDTTRAYLRTHRDVAVALHEGLRRRHRLLQEEPQRKHRCPREKVAHRAGADEVSGALPHALYFRVL